MLDRLSSPDLIAKISVARFNLHSASSGMFEYGISSIRTLPSHFSVSKVMRRIFFPVTDRQSYPTSSSISRRTFFSLNFTFEMKLRKRFFSDWITCGLVAHESSDELHEESRAFFFGTRSKFSPIWHIIVMIHPKVVLHKSWYCTLGLPKPSSLDGKSEILGSAHCSLRCR